MRSKLQAGLAMALEVERQEVGQVQPELELPVPVDLLV
jgi:hypothetical protein